MLLPRPLESNYSLYGIEIKFKNSNNGTKFTITITTFLDRVSTPPRRHYTIMIELTSLQESPSLSPYNDRARSTWSLCRCLKLIKIIKFFILSVSSRKKERKRKKEAFHNKLFGEGRVLTKFPTHLKGIICAYTNPLHFPSFSLNRQNAR